MSEVTPEICFCGHPKKSHGEFTLNGAYRCRCFDCPIDESEVAYHGFRPELPWPDSEGWWWCDAEQLEYVILHSFIFCQRGTFAQSWCVLHDGKMYHREDFDEFGPARFVKLTEQSPFTQDRTTTRGG